MWPEKLRRDSGEVCRAIRVGIEKTDRGLREGERGRGENLPGNLPTGKGNCLLSFFELHLFLSERGPIWNGWPIQQHMPRSKELTGGEKSG